ncbi:MAG: hypothetical protein APF77_05735 [Clostridia bacterium BRH_c25]|nr:MAG: hypothetical protein APF77_05735 [Clostridia bacterium BRH_c25]
MSGHNLLELVRVVDGLGDKDYLISTIAYSAAPTVEGKKPSTVVNLPRNRRNLCELWQRHKSDVAESLAVSFFELRRNEDSILVLIYKPETLNKYLLKKSSMRFLRDYGYRREMGLEGCLEHLKRRYNCECPHELGVFLGYPVKDVIGFIENQGKKCLLCRYWKVYHNPGRAKCIFNAYDKAKKKMACIILDTYKSRGSNKLRLEFN